MIGPGKYRVETLSIFSYQEATQTRYGPAARMPSCSSSTCCWSPSCS